MDKEQEDLIATGIWLLIKSNDKLRISEKKVWMDDYDKLFSEEHYSSSTLCECGKTGRYKMDPDNNNEDFCECGKRFSKDSEEDHCKKCGVELGMGYNCNGLCPECVSSSKPTPLCKKCNDECDCHMFIGGSGSICPGCTEDSKSALETKAYSILSELLNNLEDDLQMDFENAEEGYGSYEDSYKAIKKFTLPLLEKYVKQFERDAKDALSEPEEKQ